MASARNAINVLIKLLGGDEMVAELEKLGTTGEKAIGEIQSAANKVSLANLGGAINSFGSDLLTVGKRVSLAFAGISAVVSAAAPVVLLLAKSGAQAANEAVNAAQAAGLQTKSYQELAFAADSVGVSQQQLSTSMATFNKQVAKTVDETTKAGKATGQMGRDIQQGVGFTVETFKDLNVEVTRFGDSVKGAGDKAKSGASKVKTGFDDLGISVKNADGTLKTNEQLLLAVANAFQKLPDGARKSAIAVKLFGEGGAKLIPLLNQGAAGIAEFQKQAADLGIIFSDDQIRAAVAFNDSLSAMQKAIGGLLRQIGLLFAPVFTSGANAFTAIINRNRAAILSFTRDALASATQLIKDFFAVLSGRDADVTDNKWLIDWRDAIAGFGRDFKSVATGVVIPAMEGLRKAAKLVADAVNAVFGTDLSVGKLAILAAITQVLGGFRLLRSGIVLAVEAIALFSRAMLANPWLAVLTAVAGGILLWVTRTDNATVAMEAHRKIVDDVKAAYDKAQGAAKNWADVIEHTTRDQALADFRNVTAAAAEARKALQDTSVGTGVAHLTGNDLKVAEQLRDLRDAFIATGGDVDEFKKKIQSIADTSTAEPVKEFALAILDTADKLRDTETAVGQVKDIVTIFTGTAKEAQAAIEHLTGKTPDSFKPLEDSAKNAGAAVDETKAKVEGLSHQITVTRGGGANGLSKEVFDVIDGVARRAEQSKQALDGVAGSANNAEQNVKNVSNEVTNAIDGAVKPDAAKAGVDGIVGDVGRIAPAAQQAATDVSTAFGSIDAGGAAAAATAILTPFQGLPGQISAIVSGIQGLVRTGFGNLAATVSGLAAQIRAEISAIISALQAAVAQAQRLRAQASSSSSSGGGSHGGFAGGGDVVGPGTSTSDSILAWLSNGEFVNRTRSVMYYGRDLFHALNNMAIPRDALRGILRGFRSGGFVDSLNRSMTIPRFAGGGLAQMFAPAAETTQGRTPFMLQLPGGEVIDDMTIGDVSLRRLQNVSLRGARVSAGRAPRRK